MRKKNNILYDKLIMDLPHSKRILINDYSGSNSYPTSESINIKRDDESLEYFLNFDN